MRRLAVAAGLAVLLVVGVIAHQGASADHPMRLMPLGDSITYGSNIPGGYRTALWQHLVRGDGDDINFVGSMKNGPRALGDRNHEGHIGWRIDQIRAHIDGWLAAGRPDVVLLHIGTNDIVFNDDLAHAPSRLADLVSRICVDRPTVHLVVASIVPRPGQDAAVAAYNATIPGIVAMAAAKGCAVTYLDIAKAVPPLDISSDRIHPSAAGYAAMANAWYPVVASLYATFQGAKQAS